MTEAKKRTEALDAKVYEKIKEWRDAGRTVYELRCPDFSCLTQFYSPHDDAVCPNHTIPYKGTPVREVFMSDFRKVTPEQQKMFDNQRRNAKKKAYQRRPIQDGDAPVGGVGHTRDLDFEALFRAHHLEQAIWDDEHKDDDEAEPEYMSSEGAYA